MPLATRLLFLSFLVTCLSSCQPPAAPPPNIVFILIDDMGWTDAGVFGSSYYETPGIDRLAAEGVRFTSGYAACPVCSPTRASIMTGKYPATLRQTDWIPGRGNRPDQKLLQVEDLNHLELDERTLAEVLRDEGYVTAHIGKWHLGPDETHKPEHQGFDINIAGNAKGSPPSYYYPYRRVNRQDSTDVYELAGLQAGGTEGEYLTDRLGDEAVAFIRSHADQPFFLHFSHYAVHTPLQPREDLLPKYEAKGGPLPDSADFEYEGRRPVRTVQNHAVYGTMVESMDQSVERVLDALEEAGISDNTIVVFFADNGGLSTSEGWPTANVPLRTGKGWLYEGGIRVPMLVKWPGVTQPGSLCEQPVSSIDFLPTLLDMAGHADKIPAGVEGVSFAEILKNEDTLDRETLYWHYPHYSNQGDKPGGAIRSGSFKLIERFEDGSLELYDLENDLSEQNNLAAELPELTDSLAQQLRNWRVQVSAQMPEPNPDFTGE